MSFMPQKNKIFALVDANNFYASCEQAFQPFLKNKPVIVLSNNDGCIISRSKEAKELGIKMGQPLFEIKELVEKQHVHVFSSNYRLYADMSHRLYEILVRFFPVVEIYSVDECFLDLTNLSLLDLEKYIRNVRNIIYEWIKIPVSIGIGKTKTLAKLANKYAKKNEFMKGVCNSLNSTWEETILKELNIEDIWGVGSKTAKFLRKHQILTPYNLIQQNDYWIQKKLSIKGLRMVYELRGYPCYETPISFKSKKNTAVTRSFSTPISDIETLEKIILQFASKLSEKLHDQNQIPTYIGVYIRTSPFHNKEKYYSNFKSEKLLIPSYFVKDLIEVAYRILKKIYIPNKEYKKLGLIAMGLIPASIYQQDLFIEKKQKKEKQFNEVFLKLRKYYNRLGREKITFAKHLTQKSNIYKKSHVSKNFTTNIKEIPICYL